MKESILPILGGVGVNGMMGKPKSTDLASVNMVQGFPTAHLFCCLGPQ